MSTEGPEGLRAALAEDLEPVVAAEVRRAAEEDVERRLWHRDASLWVGGPEVAGRLGWLAAPKRMLEVTGELIAFAEDARGEDLTDAVLLGMGGSSLAPEVLRRSYAGRVDGLRLHVLDSTDAAAVLGQERSVDLARTLFLVSTKSGGTIETLSLYRYFRARVEAALGGEEAGRRFVAVTDPGSPLEALAADEGFRRTFLADPEIGGRYSALSHFGMVPAALLGADVRALLEGGRGAASGSSVREGPGESAGPWLGAALGALARAGRDKLTLVCDEPLGSFGLWAEQLVAESLGKGGQGIVPVAGEPLAGPEAYGADRVFLHLADVDRPDPEAAAALDALARTGHPVIALDARGGDDLGRVFVLLEIATAVAGWSLGVNPFDQPDVQEAKDRTGAVLATYAGEGRLPQPAAPEADAAEIGALLRALVAPGYLAVLAYVEPSEAFDRAVGRLRAAVRDATGAATTFGYGPRYLHSTGQLHKGGPDTGVFVAITHDGPEDADVPGAGYTFDTLKRAQALGDLEALRARGLPVAHVPLGGDAASAETLAARVEEALAGRAGEPAR